MNAHEAATIATRMKMVRGENGFLYNIEWHNS